MENHNKTEGKTNILFLSSEGENFPRNRRPSSEFAGAENEIGHGGQTGHARDIFSYSRCEIQENSHVVTNFGIEGGARRMRIIVLCGFHGT